MSDELVTWLRAQLDDDERNLAAGLSEHRETKLEGDFRFRLVEVGAKRRIIHLHPTVPEDWATEFAGDCQMCSESAPCRTVRELAFPYAGRPGYREEWRP